MYMENNECELTAIVILRSRLTAGRPALSGLGMGTRRAVRN